MHGYYLNQEGTSPKEETIVMRDKQASIEKSERRANLKEKKRQKIRNKNARRLAKRSHSRGKEKTDY